MPPLAQMAHWKSSRLISGTPLWTWNAKESFLPQPGTISELLMGMQGRSWYRPWWGSCSSVCLSGLMRRRVRGECPSPSWRKVNSGFVLQKDFRSTLSLLVGSSSRWNHVRELPHISLDPWLNDLSELGYVDTFSHVSCKDKNLAQYPPLLPARGEWMIPHSPQGPIGYSWISWFWQAYRAGIHLLAFTEHT